MSRKSKKVVVFSTVLVAASFISTVLMLHAYGCLSFSINTYYRDGFRRVGYA